MPYGGWIAAVAGVTIIAGGVTTLFGLSDIGEGITDYNVIESTLFMGNNSAYNLAEDIFKYTAIVGSTICSIYCFAQTSVAIRKNPGSASAHGGVWNKNDKSLIYYGSNGKMKYSIHFSNHNTPGIHNIPHWHTEMPHSLPYNNFLIFLLEIIKNRF